MKKNKQHLAVVPTPVLPLSPAPVVQVELSLSQCDRWFIASAFVRAPWGGGEANVLRMNTIHETLELATVPIDKTPNELSKSAKKYTLTLPDADFMIQVMCGATGIGFQGIAGPMLAKLAIRLRALVKSATPAPVPAPVASPTKPAS